VLNMTELKAVIFDMDGVIIDSEPIHYQVKQILFEKLGIEMSKEEYSAFIGSSSSEIWAALKEGYNLKESVEDLLAKQNQILIESLKSREDKTVAGIMNLLEELKKNDLKIALASSSPVKVIEVILDKLKIKEYFLETASGESFVKSKPDPEIFLYTADKLEVKSRECLVIEDSKNGVEAAKKAGMKCIGFKNPNSGDQNLSKADLIVESIEVIDMETLTDLF
jgi:beta-phosphoglucomutase family hydrolase